MAAILSKKSNRRSKIAVILSEKSRNNRRSKIAAIMCKKSNRYDSYFGFLLFLDNMAAILERRLFLLFLDNMTAILERRLFHIF
jgi:hypothetical protein